MTAQFSLSDGRVMYEVDQVMQFIDFCYKNKIDCLRRDNGSKLKAIKWFWWDLCFVYVEEKFISFCSQKYSQYSRLPPTV